MSDDEPRITDAMRGSLIEWARTATGEAALNFRSPDLIALLLAVADLEIIAARSVKTGEIVDIERLDEIMSAARMMVRGPKVVRHE